MIQQDLMIFSATVILSGWGLGFLLARLMRGQSQPPPKAILISLLAVAMPTIVALVLSDSTERSALIAQFQPRFELLPAAVALIAPFLIALAGHIGGALVPKQKNIPLPNKTALKQALGMIPLILVWALLEEIGWRGYFYAEIAKTNQTLFSAALVGLIWGIWHAPQMFFNEQLKEHFKGRIFSGMILWSIQCVLLGCILGWLQTVSGSFLLPALAHGLVNLFGNISDLSLGKEKDGLFAGTSGVFACATSLSIVVVLFGFI